jgi:CRP-like cAMP-binding protein
MTREKIKDAMRKSELLGSIDLGLADEFLDKSQTLIKRRGDPILLTGEEVLGLYLVVSGTVGVYPKRDAKQIAAMGPSDMFGEMSFVEQRKASSCIIAESSEVAVQLFAKPLILQRLESDVDFAKIFFQVVSLSLSKRLRANNQFIAEELRKGQENATRLMSAMEDLKSEAKRISKQSETQTSEMNKIHGFVNELIQSLTSMEERVTSTWIQQRY